MEELTRELKVRDSNKTQNVFRNAGSIENHRHRNAGETINILSSLLQSSSHPAQNIAFAVRNGAPADRVSLIQLLQKTHGNRYVQRFVKAAINESPCTEFYGTKVTQMKSSGFCDGCSFHKEVKGEAENTGLEIQKPETQNDASGLLGTEGITECNLSTGVAEYKIFNKECTKPCTIKHEETHKTDMTECCQKAGKAYKDAKDKKGREMVEQLWNQWKRINQNLLECHAYTEEVKCLENLERKTGCHVTKERMRIQEHQRDRYCQKVERKNLMGCVFKSGEQAGDQTLK